MYKQWPITDKDLEEYKYMTFYFLASSIKVQAAYFKILPHSRFSTQVEGNLFMLLNLHIHILVSYLTLFVVLVPSLKTAVQHAYKQTACLDNVPQ